MLKLDTLFVALEITMPVSAPDSFIDHDDAWQTEMFWVTETLNEGAKMRFKVKCKLCGWGPASFTHPVRLGLHFCGEKGDWHCDVVHTC